MQQQHLTFRHVHTQRSCTELQSILLLFQPLHAPEALIFRIAFPLISPKMPPPIPRPKAPGLLRSQSLHRVQDPTHALLHPDDALDFPAQFDVRRHIGRDFPWVDREDRCPLGRVLWCLCLCLCLLILILGRSW